MSIKQFYQPDLLLKYANIYELQHSNSTSISEQNFKCKRKMPQSNKTNGKIFKLSKTTKQRRSRTVKKLFMRGVLALQQPDLSIN